MTVQQDLANIPDLTSVVPINNQEFQNYKERLATRCQKTESLGINFLRGQSSVTGGLSKKELVIVGGRPSNGKSALMLAIAWDLALQNRKVHFFSLEMANDNCIDRLYSHVAGFDSSIITRKEYYDTNPALLANWELAFSNAIQNITFGFSDNIGRTFEQINTYILMVAKNKPDVIFIDYVNMVKHVGINKKDMIDGYIIDMRNLAIRHNLCIVLGAQINRTGANEGIPKPQELKSTGCLEEVADRVYIVHRPYVSTQEDADYHKMVVRLAKNRNGAIYTSHCHFQPETGSFRELTKAEVQTMKQAEELQKESNVRNKRLF